MAANFFGIQEEIESMSKKKAGFAREMKKLKTVSGVKLVEIVRFQQFQNALDMEVTARRKELNDVKTQARAQAQTQATNVAKQTKTVKKTAEMHFEDMEPTNLEGREKLLENLQNLVKNNIDKKVSKYIKSYYSEAYALSEYNPKGKVRIDKSDAEEENYAKSNDIFAVLVTLEDDGKDKDRINQQIDTDNNEDDDDSGDKKYGMAQQYVSTFRVASSTSWQELKDVACAFWDRKPENYQFYDEKESLIEAAKDAKLEKYFKNNKESLTQWGVVLKFDPSGKYAERVTVEDPNSRSKTGASTSTNAFAKFNKLLPRLQPYLNLDENSMKERDKRYQAMNKPDFFGDNHFCVVLILGILTLLTLLSILTERNVASDYYSVSNIERICNKTGIKNVDTVDTLVSTLTLSLAPFFDLYGSSDATTILYRPAIFRQYRINERPCTEKIFDMTCYEAKYSLETRNTSSFKTSNNQTFSFQFNKKNDAFPGEIKGFFGSYTTEAFSISYDPALLWSDQFTSNFTALLDLSSGFIVANTRAIRITLNLLDLATNRFTLFEPLIEFTPVGTIVTSFTQTNIYMPNLREDTKKPQSLLSTFSVIFATLLLIFVLVSIFLKKGGGFNLEYLITVQGFLNCLIIVFIYASQSLLNQLNGMNITVSQLRDDSLPKSMNILSQLYQDIFNVRAVAAGLLIVRLLLVFKLNTRIETFITNFEKAIPKTIALLFAICPIILAVAFLLYINLGLSEPDYNTFGEAIVWTMILLTGYSGNLLQKYSIAADLIIILATFLLYFLFFSMFWATTVETSRNNLLEYGENYHEKYVWRHKDYLSWAVAFIPNQVIVYAKKYKQKISWKGMKMGLKKIKAPLVSKKKKNQDTRNNSKDNRI